MKRTLDGHRIDAIHSDKHVVAMAEHDNVVPACTDELHPHNNHLSGISCCTNQELMGKSSSKEKRLVTLHAMTRNGPLCKRNTST
jgi:hypothetical protein